ncbi:toxin-antitoxin system YwqK family antitoxin [Kocuria sp. M1R5S2]|uniref:toxin-antitoxin system YwqK family antitoxin n=1 Tax=Kocuria rhizosphaerae TaxID=3376285 RepID=UPI00379AC65A
MDAPREAHDAAPPTTPDAAPNAVDELGRPTGTWAEKDPHGGVVQGEYVDGERHGLWRHRSDAGALRSEGHYDRGRLTGPWTWYRASGGVLQRGELLDGEKHGYWQRFTADGTPIDEGHFDRGRKSGEWTYYHPDGTVRRTSVHRGHPPQAG